MKREDAQQWVKLFQAYADGETIQALNSNGRWRDVESPMFTSCLINYRVKPKAKTQRYTVYKTDASGRVALRHTTVDFVGKTKLGAIDLILDPETDKFEIKIVDGHGE